MNNLFFYLGLAMLLTHELDAMTQSEWRLLFILRRLPEQTASATFVILHIPVITGLLWLTNHQSLRIQYWSRIIVAAFLIIHAGLHRLLENHPNYTFDSLLSLSLIYGGGLMGLLYYVSIFSSWQQDN